MLHIYIHKTNYTISPVINGLLDDNAQMIISNMNLPVWVCNPKYIKNCSNYNLSKFRKWNYKWWDDVFINNDENKIFSAFLNTYLKIVHSYFVQKRITSKLKYSPWLRDSGSHFKFYFMEYCKVHAKYVRFAKVSKETKTVYYAITILKSNKKNKNYMVSY
jgi:hypothetical protein